MQATKFNTEIKSMNIPLTVSMNCMSDFFSVNFFFRQFFFPKKFKQNPQNTVQ